MSYRNPKHSQELRYDHEYTPRKQRMFRASSQFQGSRLRFDGIYRPENTPQEKWIGKFFIPTGSIPANPNKNNYVLEYDVMKKAGGHMYRILYAIGSVGDYQIRSKPSIEKRPGQLNIVVNPENLILDVIYF